ncbi:GNAT family N-acetyltransferase [Oerskovia sp. KBS0722]|uniref:GNAT family N-acetyltransferase n=1 Tax=Oerskovia sp. KBS0722 TaxID=1179673 RepID=UPI00110D82AB|nr:GNAT family N-acetyltransferase [Oerskovia sp. KBS0722]QDW63616.1 GNAT family N-acetyltransferase [Oerskovia sp. KBS0722]
MPAVASLRAPTDEERESLDFLRLLASASGRSGAALSMLAADVRGMTTIVALIDGRVVGLAASRADSGENVLRHLAVDAARRREGTARRLVAAVRDAEPGMALIAETDDDAVTFYRRCGFTVVPLPRDPRWPRIQRYRCVLPVEAG